MVMVMVAGGHPPVGVYAIVVVPIAMPVTSPEDEPMVATEGSLLLQAPPVVASVRVVVEVTQRLSEPTMGAVAPTVTVVVTIQPGANE